MNLTDPIFTDEHKAREFFEASRWPDGKPTCPHCGGVERVYRLQDGDTHRDGLFHCNDCEGAFTVTTGTVMESSHVPLNKWALAYRLMSSAKKGISAHQLGRTVGVSYKTAWFMCHRIRESMRDAIQTPMGGRGCVVESDETFVGGKPRKNSGGDGRKTIKYRKTGVQILVERSGQKRARAIVLPNPFDGAVRENVIANVARGTHLNTDQAKSYQSIEYDIGGKHSSVDHGAGEYARREGGHVHSNTAESWNALLKRSIYGSFHHISREHLSRYCDEISFRWDRREMDDSERTVAAIKGGEGKRLTYRRTRSAQQA